MAAAIFVSACEGNQSASNENQTSGDTMSVEQTSTSSEEAAIPSPRKQAEGSINGVNVVVDYGSPAVKGREIWGGLEPFDNVWRAGANETTSVEFSEDVMIDGTEVPAGKYGVYMIPKENEEWVFILNTDWSQEEHNAWGAYNYNEENDVLRVEVSPDWADQTQERLTYEVVEDGISFAWEKARLKVPVSKAA